MARRRFRDIAVISGLVFQGFPINPSKQTLASGSQNFFDVFKDYEPDNLLYQQALEELLITAERGRMTQVFENIQKQTIVWRECSQPTHFLSLITDRIRSKLSQKVLKTELKTVSTTRKSCAVKTINIAKNEFVLHPSGAVYWVEKKTLLLADVHLGKVAHFRKNGIAVPRKAEGVFYQKIEALLQTFSVDRIIFLGDLFHSDQNNEWHLFAAWVSLV